MQDVRARPPPTNAAYLLPTGRPTCRLKPINAPPHLPNKTVIDTTAAGFTTVSRPTILLSPAAPGTAAASTGTSTSSNSSDTGAAVVSPLKQNGWADTPVSCMTQTCICGTSGTGLRYSVQYPVDYYTKASKTRRFLKHYSWHAGKQRPHTGAASAENCPVHGGGTVVPLTNSTSRQEPQYRYRKRIASLSLPGFRSKVPRLAAMRDYIPLLYEDQYVRVTDSSIIINNYYFPFGSKSIAIDQVLSIDTDIELDLLSEQYHAWGFCRSTNIWWAKDGSRIDSRERLVSRPYVIVRLTNSWVSCGFTMSHPQAGLQILRALLADKKPRAPPNFAEYASNNGVMYRPTTQ